jgi:hypothetical protein
MLVAVRYACRGSRFTSGWADGPPPGYQPPVPAQDGLRCHQHPGPPGRGRRRTSAAITARFAQDSSGRATCRCRTAN